MDQHLANQSTNRATNQESQAVPAPAVEVHQPSIAPEIIASPIGVEQPDINTANDQAAVQSIEASTITAPATSTPESPATTPVQDDKIQISPDHLKQELNQTDDSNIIAIAYQASELVNKTLVDSAG